VKRSKVLEVENRAIGDTPAFLYFTVYKSQKTVREKAEDSDGNDIYGCCRFKGDVVEVVLWEDKIGSGTVAHEVLHASLELYRIISGKRDILLEDGVISSDHPEGHPEECVWPEEQIAFLVDDATRHFWNWWINEQYAENDEHS